MKHIAVHCNHVVSDPAVNHCDLAVRICSSQSCEEGQQMFVAGMGTLAIGLVLAIREQSIHLLVD